MRNSSVVNGPGDYTKEPRRSLAVKARINDAELAAALGAKLAPA